MQKLKKALGIETKKAVEPMSTTHNGNFWDIQLDPVYGFCIYRINPKRTIEQIVLDTKRFRTQNNTKLTITTNMASYDFDLVFVEHVLDNESGKIIVGKVIYNGSPAGHVYSLAKTSIVLDEINHNTISVVV